MGSQSCDEGHFSAKSAKNVRKQPPSQLQDPIKKLKPYIKILLHTKVYKCAQQHLCEFLDQLDHFPGYKLNFIAKLGFHKFRRRRIFLAEKGQKTLKNLYFSEKKLGINKYHQNTCLYEILGQLEHFWAQNGNPNYIYIQVKMGQK